MYQVDGFAPSVAGVVARYGMITRMKKAREAMEQRLATEIAHKERLLATEFAHEVQVDRRTRRIEWAVSGSVVLLVMVILIASISW